MPFALSPDEIVAKIEQTWITKRPTAGPTALDEYVRWLSHKWTTLSEGERQLLIENGAALFDANLRDW